MKTTNYKHQVIFDSHEKPIKLDMKTYQKYKTNIMLQPRISPRKTDKVIYNQKMVNDYVDIINHRLKLEETDVDSRKLPQKNNSMYKSISSQHTKQISLVEPVTAEKLQSKTNLDNHSSFFHSRKSLTREDKLYLLSDPLQEMLKTRQSITDLRAIEIEGDEFTQQYKNKINEDYEKEICRKDMIQRRIFDSQLKYQGNNSIKQFIFQQNMKASQKFHTEPIDKNIHIIKEFIVEDKLDKPRQSKLITNNKINLITLKSTGIKSFQDSENNNNSSAQRFEDLYKTCNNFYKESRQIKTKIMRLKRQTWRKYQKILQIGASQKEIKID
ncbi:unnamed protein product [Paramecium pentaurelia]|uniref:Uncharacterized protein n=1 Tax=Paramecium pentaurelia TaxID=43138 RepID=A0A8S1XXU2_9CILI|nr:unnamed protein product [Paramecium pentaurelia]